MSESEEAFERLLREVGPPRSERPDTPEEIEERSAITRAMMPAQLAAIARHDEQDGAMPESEEALLRRAAKTVRERGKAATQGRTLSADVGGGQATWAAWPHCDYDPDEPEFAEEVARGACGVQVSVPGGVENITGRTPNPGDAAWIAMLGPQLAEPLAAWLEYAAGIAEWSPHIPMMQMPLDVARALLGEPALSAPVGDDREEEK